MRRLPASTDERDDGAYALLIEDVWGPSGARQLVQGAQQLQSVPAS